MREDKIKSTCAFILNGYRTAVLDSIDAMEILIEHLSCFDALLFPFTEADLVEELLTIHEVVCQASERGIKCYVSDHIPECVKLSYLGGQYYLEFTERTERVNVLRRKETLGYDEKCETCTFKMDCNGIVNLPFGLQQRAVRFATQHRLSSRTRLRFEVPRISLIHDNCISHIGKHEQNKTDRTIKYAKAYNAKTRKVDYDQRVTYYCRYLAKTEINQELCFMKTLATTDLQDHVFTHQISSRKATGYAYSIVSQENAVRTSHYLYFRNTDDLLSAFDELKLLNCPAPGNLRPVFIGLDYVDSVFSGYKVYYCGVCPQDVLKELVYYTSAIMPDEILRPATNVLLVFRFDWSGKLVSVKIEATPIECEEVVEAIDKNFDINVREKSGEYVHEYFAYDFDLSGGLKKVTSYLTVPIVPIVPIDCR